MGLSGTSFLEALDVLFWPEAEAILIMPCRAV